MRHTHGRPVLYRTHAVQSIALTSFSQPVPFHPFMTSSTFHLYPIPPSIYPSLFFGVWNIILPLLPPAVKVLRQLGIPLGLNALPSPCTVLGLPLFAIRLHITGTVTIGSCLVPQFPPLTTSCPVSLLVVSVHDWGLNPGHHKPLLTNT